MYKGLANDRKDTIYMLWNPLLYMYRSTVINPDCRTPSPMMGGTVSERSKCARYAHIQSILLLRMIHPRQLGIKLVHVDEMPSRQGSSIHALTKRVDCPRAAAAQPLYTAVLFSATTVCLETSRMFQSDRLLIDSLSKRQYESYVYKTV